MHLPELFSRPEVGSARSQIRPNAAPGRSLASNQVRASGMLASLRPLTRPKFAWSSSSRRSTPVSMHVTRARWSTDTVCRHDSSILPGQFWLHKNHRRLFEALHVLAQRGVRPHVVLTGGTLEYRDPQLSRH